MPTYEGGERDDTMHVPERQGRLRWAETARRGIMCIVGETRGLLGRGLDRRVLGRTRRAPLACLAEGVRRQSL